MNIEIADRLVQLRRDNGLSQEDLASRLGVSRQAVSKWERAESSPDTDNLIALARLYGISLDALLLGGPAPGYGGAAAAEQSAPLPEPGFSFTAEQAPQYGEYQSTAPEDLSAAAAAWDAAAEARRAAEWKKRRKFLLSFPFPVLVTFVYLALGFTIGWWHPGWMLFFTVPVYYCVVSGMK